MKSGLEKNEVELEDRGDQPDGVKRVERLVLIAVKVTAVTF